MVELLQQQFWVVKNAACSSFFGRCIRRFYAFCLVFGFDQFFLLLGNFSQLIVEVVAVEKFLDGVTSQVGDVFLKLWVLEVFPLFIDVLSIKVIFQRRDERRFDLFFL
jgi:hypothetical protein